MVVVVAGTVDVEVEVATAVVDGGALTVTAPLVAHAVSNRGTPMTRSPRGLTAR
jgi:hypothetical protein